MFVHSFVYSYLFLPLDGTGVAGHNKQEERELVVHHGMVYV